MAGELARDYDVLPWPVGEALRAAGACFLVWLAARGGAGAAEDAIALAQVRAFLEAHSESRFTPLLPSATGSGPSPPELTRTVNRAGWRRHAKKDEGSSKNNVSDKQDVSEQWEFLILPETWKSEVCKGLDGKRVAEILVERMLLLGATARHRAGLVTIPGEGKRRVYIVSGAILEGDDAQ
jgi:putative DNA primase/helicase